MATDPTPAIALYQGITLSVSSSNVQSGNKITVTLGERQGKSVAWSTGQDFTTSAGIHLSSTSGAVPVSSFAITSDKVTFTLAANDSGQPTTFNLSAFLAAASDIEQFTLALTSDDSTEVTATLPMQESVELGSSPTIFDWSPS